MVKLRLNKVFYFFHPAGFNFRRHRLKYEQREVAFNSEPVNSSCDISVFHVTSYYQCFIGFGLNKRNMSCTHKFYDTLSKFIRTIPLSLKKLPLSLSPYQGKMQYQLGIPWTCTPLGNCEEQLPSLTVGRLLVICRPTVGQLSTNTLPTVDRQIYLDFSEKITSCRISVDQQSTDCRLTVGDLSVRCWQSVGNFMPIIALKSVWFKTLDNCIEKIKWNSQ